MTNSIIADPFKRFADLEGQPLDEGYIYVGVQGSDPETTPQAVTLEDGTPVAQPIRTLNGVAVVGTVPVNIYTASPFSLRVRNKALEQVLYDPDYGGDGAVGFPATFSDVPAFSFSGSRIETAGAVAVDDGGFSTAIRTTSQAALLPESTARINAAVALGQSNGSATTAVTAMERRFRKASANGTYFAIVNPATHLAYKSAGDTALDTIQASIDLNHYWDAPRARLAGGELVCDGSVWHTRGDAFRQIELRGSGRVFGGANSVSTGTELVFTSTSMPGIICQGFRESTIGEMTITGPWKDAIIARNLGLANPIDGFGNPIDDTPISVWYAELGITFERYAPRAGIVMDAFVVGGGGPPPGGAGLNPYVIPDASAKPDWLGPLALYPPAPGRASSSNMLIDASVQGWEVGVCVNPSTAIYQTDFVAGSAIAFTQCIYAFAINQNQGRGVFLPRTTGSYIHTYFTNRAYGTQAGRFNGTIFPNVGAAINLFDLNVDNIGTLTIQDGYFESQWRFGDVYSGTTGGNGTLIFAGGEYNFGFPPERRGVPLYILGSPVALGGGADFDAYTFTGTGMSWDAFQAILVRRISMENIKIVAYAAHNDWWEAASGNPLAIADNNERKYRKMAHNGTFGIGFVASDPVPDTLNIIGLLVDTGGTNKVQARLGVGPYLETHRKHCIPHWQNVASPKDEGYSPSLQVDMPQRTGTIGKTQLTGWSAFTGKRYSATLPAGYIGANEWVARRDAIAPGRVVYDGPTGTYFWIVSVNYSTGAIVFEPLTNHYKPVGSSEWAHRTAFSTSSGALLFLETGFFLPPRTLIGDVTAGSAIVTNLRGPDGSTAWLTAPGDATALPQNGDWLYYDVLNPNPYPFRNQNSKVITFDGAARTMTMSGNTNFSASQTGVTFPIFRRGD